MGILGNKLSKCEPRSFTLTIHSNRSPIARDQKPNKNKNPPLNSTPVLPMKLETLALAPSNHRIAVVRMINDETRRESREREIESDRGR